MAEFFENDLKIDIESERYTLNGTSKMKRFRTFIELEDGQKVARALVRLWDYRTDLYDSELPEKHRRLREKFFSLIEKLGGNHQEPETDVLTEFVPNQTLEELIGDLKRSLAADRPEVALDRLHTYCMMQFAHLLDKRGEECSEKEPLNSRFGKYVKHLRSENELTPMTLAALKGGVGLFEKYNEIRNRKSLSHPNEILPRSEARYIYDIITAMLRFIKKVDASNYGP